MGITTDGTIAVYGRRGSWHGECPLTSDTYCIWSFQVCILPAPVAATRLYKSRLCNKPFLCQLQVTIVLVHSGGLCYPRLCTELHHTSTAVPSPSGVHVDTLLRALPTASMCRLKGGEGNQTFPQSNTLATSPPPLILLAIMTVSALKETVEGTEGWVLTGFLHGHKQSPHRYKCWRRRVLTVSLLRKQRIRLGSDGSRFPDYTSGGTATVNQRTQWERTVIDRVTHPAVL